MKKVSNLKQAPKKLINKNRRQNFPPHIFKHLYLCELILYHIQQVTACDYAWRGAELGGTDLGGCCWWRRLHETQIVGSDLLQTPDCH